MKNKLSIIVFKSKKSLLKIIGSVMCIATVIMSFAIPCFAVGEVTPSEMAPDAAATQIFNLLKTQLNLTTILSVIGVSLLASLGMVLGWWAIRKVYAMLIKAFTKGKGGAG